MGESFQVEHRGCQLAYQIKGEGPPVLMIQGAGLHGNGWQPQVEGLASQYRCLTFDNRGMARSQPIGAPITIDQLAEDAAVLMDAAGMTSAHIVGHSMGGLIALAMALNTRQRVRSLSLLCTFARGQDATKLTMPMLWTGLRTRIGTRRMRRNAFLELVMPAQLLAQRDRESLAAQLAPIFGHDLADHPPVVMKQLSAMSAYNALPRLKELAGLPTLVVSAKEDRIATPQLGRAIADNLPGARFIEIPDAAHGVTIQCSERINNLLLEQLALAEQA